MKRALKMHLISGNDLKTFLLHRTAFLCVSRFLRLASFGTVNALMIVISVTFQPLFSVIPKIFSNFVAKKMGMNDSYPSKLLEKAVGEFSKLPGVGRKTALRFVLHLLRQDVDTSDALGESVIRLCHDVRYCKICHNVSDTDVCDICSNPQRDASILCVVENIQDVMAIENTQQFHGLYHVLGGVISPMDGIGPSDLQLDSLVKRVEQGGVKEVILALNPTMEGDTTNFYISRKLANNLDVKLTVLARGVSVGDELEYTDEVTLGRSIVNRISLSEQH